MATAAFRPTVRQAAAGGGDLQRVVREAGVRPQQDVASGTRSGSGPRQHRRCGARRGHPGTRGPAQGAALAQRARAPFHRQSAVRKRLDAEALRGIRPHAQPICRAAPFDCHLQRHIAAAIAPVFGHRTELP
jgi:hypothetical protein